MTSSALALQKAVYAAFVADAGVGALIGDRIYDGAPRDAVFPYSPSAERQRPIGAPAARTAPSTG